MYNDFQKHLQATLQEIREAGLYKNERVIITPQSSGIAVEGGQEVIFIMQSLLIISKIT